MYRNDRQPTGKKVGKCREKSPSNGYIDSKYDMLSVVEKFSAKAGNGGLVPRPQPGVRPQQRPHPSLSRTSLHSPTPPGSRGGRAKQRQTIAKSSRCQREISAKNGLQKKKIK
jgi:hypothetical protein